MKKWYLLLICGILILAFILNSHSIPYPANKRAFIPRFLDAQYKEFKKFAKKEIGRVLYAKPLTIADKFGLNEDSFYVLTERYSIVNANMFVGIEFIYLNDMVVYIYIKEFGYYGGWNQWVCNFFIFPNTIQKNYNLIENITIDISQIIQNKDTIGKLKWNNAFNSTYSYEGWIILKNLLGKPNYLDNLGENYNDFRILK